MRVPEDDHFDSGRFRSQIDRFSNVGEVDQMLTNFDGLVPGDALRPDPVVNVSADRDNRCDGTQSIEYILPADVAGMEDTRHSPQSFIHCRP